MIREENGQFKSWYEENEEARVVGTKHPINYGETTRPRIRYSDPGAAEFDVDTFHLERIGHIRLPAYQDPSNPFYPFGERRTSFRDISKNAFRCRIPNCNPLEDEKAYCRRDCYFPIGQSKFLIAQQCKTRQFSPRRISISQKNFCCICPHATSNLQITYTSDRLNFVSAETFEVRKDPFCFVVKCIPAYEYFRICQDEIQIKKKMKEIGPLDPYYKLLKSRFFIDKKGVWAYKSAPECVLNDRPDYLCPDYDELQSGTRIRDRNIPSDTQFRRFILNTLQKEGEASVYPPSADRHLVPAPDGPFHTCPPQSNLSNPLWSPKSWIFKTIGYKAPENKFCYRLALFSIPQREYNRKKWFGEFKTAEQYFCLERTGPRYPLTKINDPENRKRKMGLNGEPLPNTPLDPRAFLKDSELFPNECICLNSVSHIKPTDPVDPNRIEIIPKAFDS